jgi:hypothetical protein
MAKKNNKENQEPQQNQPFPNDAPKGHFYQPVIYYREEYKVGFHKEQLWYPFTAPNVFMTVKEAEAYAAIYIRSLIHTGDLPEDCYDKNVDGSVDLNEYKVKVAITDVIVTGLDMGAKDNG